MRVGLASLVVLFALVTEGSADACKAGDACCMALPAGADQPGYFTDKMGRLGTQIPTGKLVDTTVVTSCLGVTTDPTMLGAYSCGGDGNTDVRHYSDFLDHRWVQRIRTCADGTMPSDGTGGCFYPPKGLIYDLGGPSNKVVLFPMVDHGPLPQEAFEYAVYLSDNPNATDVVPRCDPKAQNCPPNDPSKWNEATLLKFYEQGWNPDPSDVSDDDVTVWGLPCGITFRYVSLVSGNNGNPDPACVYYSSDDEIDAVAGLSEDESGICPDRDMDGHADKACGGDDCDDSDPKTHPGAPEPCDATKDLNCDGTIGGCPTGETCASHVCQVPCGAGEFPCSGDAECVAGFCTTAPCGNGPPCPPGQVCSNGTCVDPCANAICPVGQSCIDGKCVDLCANLKCAMNQVCTKGACGPSCACLGCAAGQTCGTDGRCVDMACAGKMCPAGMACQAGNCVDGCSIVTCPLGERCTGGACVPDPCFGHDCGAGRMCDETTGNCYSILDMTVPPDLATPDLGQPVAGGRSVQGGCACSTSGGDGTLRGVETILLSLLVGAWLTARRRRTCHARRRVL